MSQPKIGGSIEFLSEERRWSPITGQPWVSSRDKLISIRSSLNLRLERGWRCRSGFCFCIYPCSASKQNHARSVIWDETAWMDSLVPLSRPCLPARDMIDAWHWLKDILEAWAATHVTWLDIVLGHRRRLCLTLTSGHVQGRISPTFSPPDSASSVKSGPLLPCTMIPVASLLNPLPPSIKSSHKPQALPRSRVSSSDSAFSTRKKLKMSKGATLPVKAKPNGKVRYSPCDLRNDVVKAEHLKFHMEPVSSIKDYPRRIPYNSDKKTFQERTGRDAFEGNWTDASLLCL